MVALKQAHRRRIPFDPFARHEHLNLTKSTGLLCVKQQECIAQLAKQSGSELQISFIDLAKSVRNLLDGSLPVGDALSTSSKKTGAYLEKVSSIQ